VSVLHTALQDLNTKVPMTALKHTANFGPIINELWASAHPSQSILLAGEPPIRIGSAGVCRTSECWNIDSGASS
jgi:hypothetical protein